MTITILRRALQRWAVAAALAVAGHAAWALDVQPYTAELLADRQQTGGAVALHFCADWCTTCAAQKQALTALRDDPSLAAMLVLVVDFERQKKLRRALGVSAPGTLVVYKGEEEVGRSSGQTARASLWALLTRATD